MVNSNILLGKQKPHIIKSFTPWSAEHVNILSSTFLSSLDGVIELKEICPIRPRWWEVLVNEIYSPASMLKERSFDTTDLETTLEETTKFIYSETKFDAFKGMFDLLQLSVLCSPHFAPSILFSNLHFFLPFLKYI